MNRRFNRRAVLRAGAVGGAGLTGAALIGCGGSSEEEEDPAAALAALREKRGTEAPAAASGVGSTATEEHSTASAAEPAAASGHGEGPAWTYDGAGGPEQWGELNPDYAACSAGRTQSPINITETTGVGGGVAAVSYQQSALTVINNGHTIQANVPPGSALNVDGKTFGLLQFHFHAPSEHALDGQHFPLEMHLVHRNNEGNLAVLGVFFADGATNESLAAVWDVMPHTTDGQGIVDSFNIESLLPSSRELYRYSGSLTTPPCSEGVRWMLLQTPVSASSAQVAAFADLVGPNNRPLQPLWAREVLREGSQSIVGSR